jgi:hypothetical protein
MFIIIINKKFHVSSQIRDKILEFLDTRDFLTLRGVSVSVRAEVDHKIGLDVIANDHFMGNGAFVRRVKAKSLNIDFLRKDYSGTNRKFVKYPLETEELNLRCSIPQSLLSKTLTELTNLVRLGFKGKALTCMDFFPEPPVEGN